MFIGNRAYDYYYGISGEAISYYSSGQQSATVIECQFINNYASGNGGGFYNARGRFISDIITSCFTYCSSTSSYIIVQEIALHYS